MKSLLITCILSSSLLTISANAVDEDTWYAHDKVFRMRPAPERETFFGHVGTTGLILRIHRDVALKVEKIVPGSPADGKFQKGDTIAGVQGMLLKTMNPYVALGNALTYAEAHDGRMAFDVLSANDGTPRTETIQIPVLGSYSKTWPVNCEKSQKIITQTAGYYADKSKFKQGGIPGALGCLFLLSTGDDQYLPRVKEYFDDFPKDVSRIGDHTWNNGYNGIACAEYYLRTGDRSVLPILQHFCDDAKRRQKFGCGWTHWGTGISPGYVASGLMNPAGAQILTTMLLAKECGVDVDEETLLGSLRYFYRFAGRGTVPYGDHRGEGGLGSNGKDGMIAAAMQVATGARGDVTIYQEARDYLAMSMITSYPLLVQGHGDEGRGDGIWRSIIPAYLMDKQPKLYRQSMDRLTWWHDLSREAGGSVGIGTLVWGHGEIGSSGPGIALSYTAPLKTLRITGAPRSKHAKDFTLPEQLWGTKADRAFLSIDHHAAYRDLGPDEPTHLPFYALGGAYHKPKNDLSGVPQKAILKNVYHKRFMIRVQAAKGLRETGAFDALEQLLGDPDPRVRRAALDGMIDYNYWFGIGRKPIKTEQFSPAMLASIRKMLSNPDESWWVVDGALMALKFAPAEDIAACKPLIMPWTKHADWWLRESAFAALSGLEGDEALYLDVLPTMLEMMTTEYHTQPRQRMLAHFKGALKKAKTTSPAGKLIIAGLRESVGTSEVITGQRSPEGAFNVAQAATACLQDDPGSATAIALMIRERFDVFSTGDLIKLVGAPNSSRENPPYGLFSTIEQLSADQRKELTDILCNDYRGELVKRMKAEGGVNEPLIDTLIDLTKLREPVAGWTALGKIAPADRIWRFQSFDPLTEKDRRHPREKKRFRDVALPDALKGWNEVGYDDSAWSKGKAPIGVGVCKSRGVSFENKSDWGKGEFLIMRTTFDVDKTDHDLYRLSILAKQGFHVYLNGHKINTYVWWKDMPHYRTILLGSGSVKHLRKGTNVLTAYGNVEYEKKTHKPQGQMDLFIEGLRISDLK